MRVKGISVINYWGEDNRETLPKTLVVNLKRNTAWSLGTEVVLDTSGEDEALRVEPEDIPIESKDDDAETHQ